MPAHPPSTRSAEEWLNRRFVAALLRAYLEARLIPPGWSVERLRAALTEYGVIR